jgi:ketosteroid isomerase-like protein
VRRQKVVAPIALFLLLAFAGWTTDQAPERRSSPFSPPVSGIHALAECAVMGEAVPGSIAQGADLRIEIAGLVQTELDFSKAAGEKGIRAAFLLFLAERSVVFRPGPVDGRKAYSDIQEIGGTLSWYPTVADISRTGDLGYTSGPYESRSGKAGDPVRCGNYASFWRKQPDGKWQVILDTGAPNPAPDSRPAAWQAPREIRPAYRPAARAVEEGAERDGLRKADRAFSAQSKSGGVDRAYAAYLADNARILRRDAMPLLGKGAILAWLSQKRQTWSWEPATAELGSGADLGYTLGILTISADGTPPGEGRHYYTRFWKRDASGAWKVVLDVAQPFPPSQAKHSVSQ